MIDYGALLEETMEAYWGRPKKPIYFSNYCGDKFEMRAIIFTLSLFEINYKYDEYSDEELFALKEYESKSWNKLTTYDENIKILELLAKHKKLI